MLRHKTVRVPHATAASGEVPTAQGDDTWDNATPGAGPGGVLTVLATSATPQSITNDATVTDFLAYTIPGGTLTAGRLIRVHLGGIYLNNSAAVRVPVWAVTLGGTTLWQCNSPSLAANAASCTWRAEFNVACESATLAHLCGRLFLSSATAPTTGLGDLSASAGRIDGAFTTVAAGVAVSSLASDRLLSFNFNHPTNTATQTLTRTHYSIELL